MAQEYKVKGLSSLGDIKSGQMQEVELEGLDEIKVLLANTEGKVHAVSSKCTHYGAPLKNGVLAPDGRLTCPWHGACFKVSTGDVEDAPALDPLATFQLSEKNGSVFVHGEESAIKANRKVLNVPCTASGQERVVVVGGGSGATGAIEGLRGGGFKGAITVITAEAEGPYDRTKLSKALIADGSKIEHRSKEWYKTASIDMLPDIATKVDFENKLVYTQTGSSHPYTKLILATGGVPRSLPLPGLKEGELKNVFLLRSLKHTQAITSALGKETGKKVVVIGSSFIGMEVANCIAGMKHSVSVIGMESEPCENVFGAKVGKIFRGLLEKNGVKFYLSAGVDKASASSADSSAVGAVHLKDGTTLEADVVIEGVGVAPATQFLKESPGAPSLNKDGSITTDDHFQIPGLEGSAFAIGDIASYPYRGSNVRIEHWNVAQNAGRTVAAVINGKSGIKPFIPVFWSALGSQLRYCGNTMASNGYDDVVVKGDTSKPSFAAFYTKGDDVVAVATMGMDPVMSKSAELMRRGKMLSAKDIRGDGDVLQASL